MNPQQKTAIENPCRFAFETMQPRFRVVHGDASIIVTVNFGYE